MSLDELYQEVILDHFKHPRCQGCVTCPQARCSMHNPLCGDQIEVSVDRDKTNITKVAFTGHGCAISQASASMMSELCSGKSVDQAKKLLSSFRSVMHGEVNGDQVPELGDALALEGVKKFAARIKCALLAWEALDKCLGQLTCSPEAGCLKINNCH